LPSAGSKAGNDGTFNCTRDACGPRVRRVISCFTDGLRFTLVEETPLGADKRWVVVAPPESQGASLLFAEAATLEQSLQFGIT